MLVREPALGLGLAVAAVTALEREPPELAQELVSEPVQAPGPVQVAAAVLVPQVLERAWVLARAQAPVRTPGFPLGSARCRTPAALSAERSCRAPAGEVARVLAPAERMSVPSVRPPLKTSVSAGP